MPDRHRYGLILAGGRGTRFWPRSRKRHAKQVLSVVGETSLIQATVERLRPIIPDERLWVLTNTHLRDEIVEQLPGIPAAQILAEPEQRNTAPALGVAAHILHSIDRDAVLGVFPSDHVIAKPKRYLQFLRPAFDAASKGRIVVLGIAPRWPETGYGYIELPRGVKAGSLAPVDVLRFREKPDLRTAKKYVAGGRHFWNAGMFFWRADVMLEGLRKYLPKTATLISSLPAFSHADFADRLNDAFPRLENISIDYALLERAKNVVALACDDIGWNDVGSWNAVYELLPHDGNGNAVRSLTVSSASGGNYVDAGSKLVALLGVNGLIVVDTPDALLIADRSQAQKVSEIVRLLELNKLFELL